ncbi:MAG: SH3 domain-containing protein [Verrucomicrobiota bacterium JB023]|nr:SH3 domain-containing protein [Verrucomicrobiota bacterium JB023]
MNALIANADYEENDRNPIHLKVGQEVTTGPQDSDWPGWIWVETNNEQSGYVPEAYLEPVGPSRFSVLQAFDGKVLKVKKGEMVHSEIEIEGWHWCRNGEDEAGWLPAYLLKEQQP